MYEITKFDSNRFFIIVDENTLINLRECCSDYLMHVGFDKDYVANEKGNILEDLIDKFYTG